MGIKIDANNVIILNPKIISKKEYLAGLSDVIIVGDSETEYMCADNSNTVVFLVKTGLRNVEKYTPKRNVHILESINDFYTVNKHE